MRKGKAGMRRGGCPSEEGGQGKWQVNKDLEEVRVSQGAISNKKVFQGRAHAKALGKCMAGTLEKQPGSQHIMALGRER